MSGVGHRLAALRKDRGYSVNRLAKVSGVNEATIRAWEKGTSPRLDGLERVATSLNVPVALLLTEAEGAQHPGLAKVRRKLDDLEALVRETRGIIDATGEGS